MFNTRSKAQRAVKANLARQAETKRARRDTAAAARHTSLEPLRQEIRELVPEALTRIESDGFAGGTIIKLSRGARMFGKEYEGKVAWRIAEYKTKFKGEMMPETALLLEDGV